MKIALITPHFEPVIGGTPTVVKNIAKNLAKSKHIEVFTIAYNKEDAIKEEKEHYIINRTEYRRLKLLSNISFHFKILKKLKDFDIVHVFHPYFALSGYLSSVLYRKKLVISLMGWDTYTPLKKTNFFLKLMMRLFLKRASVIFSPSKEMKKRAKEQGVKENIVIIPHGININRDKINRKQKENLKERLGIKNKFIFLVVERLHPVKDPLFLLDVWKDVNLPDAYLLIAGGGELYNKMQIKISKEEIENVKMLSFVSPEKVRKLYSASDVLLHYSLYESFGLILLEAMKYGLPVIATKVGAIPEIVSDKEGMLIKLNDKETFKHAITKMTENKKIYNSFSRNCLKKAKKYDWSEIIKYYFKFYKN